MSNDTFGSDFNSNPPSQQVPILQRSIAKIAEALAKAQAEMVQPEKNKTVKVYPKKRQDGYQPDPYTFDYADYNAIVEAVRIPLSKHGIAFTHLIDARERELILLTRLIHSSGEYLESIYPLPRSGDPKDFGGAITYGKRYCLSAITGCVADDDADAEPENVTEFKSRQGGQSAPHAPKGPVIAPKTQAPPAVSPPAVAGNPTAAEIAQVFSVATARGWSVDQVKIIMETRWKISATKDLTRERYTELLDLVKTKTYPQACAVQS